MLHYKGLQGRIMAALVSVTLVSIISLGLVAFWRERSALQNQLSLELTSSVTYTQQRLQDWLRERQADVRFLAADTSNRENFLHLLNTNTAPNIAQLHRTHLTALLRGLQQTRPAYRQLFIADATGTILVASDPALVGRLVADNAAFRQTLQQATTAPNQVYIEDIRYDDALGAYVMCFGYPLLMPADPLHDSASSPAQTLGVVLTVVDVETTVFRILTEWRTGTSGTAILSRAEGDNTRILNQVLRDKARPLERVLPPPPDPQQARPAYWAARGREDMQLTVDHLQAKVLTVYRYIPEMKWGLVLKMDTSEVFAPLYDLVRHVLFIALGVLLVAICASILIARTLTKPLAELVMAARAVAAGETPIYTTLQRQDEIGILARSFRDMVDVLHRQQQQLKAANEVAGGILSSRPVDVILQDVVQAAQRLTGAITAQFQLHGTAEYTAPLNIQSPTHSDDLPFSPHSLPRPNGALAAGNHKKAEPWNNFSVGVSRQESEKGTVEMVIEAPYLAGADGGNGVSLPRMGGSLGTLWVQKAVNQPFSTADSDTLQALTTYAAVALSNARLVERLQSWNLVLEQKVEERTHRLEEANQRLLVLDKMKSDLLYSISHELRNPISNLKLQLDLLNQYIDSPRREKYVSALVNQVNMLGRLVNDMLELVQIDGMQHQFVFTNIDFNELVADIVKSGAALLQETKKSIRLSFLSNPASIMVSGEQKHLCLAITHLLRNAINFTAEGEIKVTIGKGEDGICLQIQDTGIGIAESDLPHIFERFFRGANVSQSTIPGSGLGLSVAEKIILLHQGQLTIQSTLGAGTSVRVWLPTSEALSG